MRGEAASQQPAEDTSPLQPKSKPPAPCCHSILQRRLLRKSDAGPRGLLGVVVQRVAGRDGSWAVLDTLNDCRVGWSKAPLKYSGSRSFTAALAEVPPPRGGYHRPCPPCFSVLVSRPEPPWFLLFVSFSFLRWPNCCG